MVHRERDRARAVAHHLLEMSARSGIFGKESMPEDVVPAGVQVGSEEHVRFITLTGAIDHVRDADQLRNAARATFTAPATRYLFQPETVAQTGQMPIITDRHRHGLSRKQERDAVAWQTSCTTLTRHFDGQVGTVLSKAQKNAPKLLALIRSHEYLGGVPHLKGKKIGSLWIRMLHVHCQVELAHLREIPLPVDVHTAQATLQTGCVRTDQTGEQMAELKKAVQQVWKDALASAEDGASPLWLDEPLWRFRRQRCRQTRTWPCAYRARCPVVEECQPERIWLRVAGNPDQEQSAWRIGLTSPGTLEEEDSC